MMRRLLLTLLLAGLGWARPAELVLAVSAASTQEQTLRTTVAAPSARPILPRLVLQLPDPTVLVIAAHLVWLPTIVLLC